MGARKSSQITERDRELLGMLAEHRVMVTPQIAAGLGVADATAGERLRGLRELQLVGYEPIFRDQPSAAWITRRGLDTIESRLPAPSVDLKGYRHDVGVGWMWLAAQRGAFGPVSAVVSEREMHSHDLRSDRTAERYGSALGGLDSRGQMTRHYPDLLVTTTAGHRVALELELTAKTARRLDKIMRGYAGDGRIDGVLYLVPTASLQRLVTAAVARAGMTDLVRVERLTSGLIEGAPDPGGRKPPAAVRGAGPVARGSRGRGAGGSPLAADGPER